MYPASTFFIFFYFLIILASGNQVAAQPIQINQETETLNLSPLASVFADSTGKLSFDAVRKQAFVPHRNQAFQFGFSSSVYWFRFTIEAGKQPNLNQWYLLWSDGLRDNVDIYIPQPTGSWKVLEGGMLAPPDRKAYKGLFPVYKLGVFQPNTVQTYYLRLEATEAINGQLTLQTHQAYIDSMPATLAMVWLVIGIQLLRVFYNIILARYIRDTSFRWYVFHTVIVTASVLGSFGVTGNMLSQYPHLASFFNVAFYQLMPATYTLFIFSLLSVRRNYPRLRWVFFAIVGCSILQLVLFPFVPRMYVLLANNYLFLFTEAFLITICSHALIRRVPMNGYLLIPCFITLVPFIFLNLRALGILEYDWIYPMIYATNFMEIVALALVLGKIIQAAELKRLQTEQALFTEKVEAEKLAEIDSLKTRFFTNISHEFRTPLTLLLGPINDLRQKFPTEAIYQVMYRNATRLQSLINQLLDLAKLDGGQLRPDHQTSDLATDLRLWVASFESMAQSRQITLTLNQPGTHFPATYDSDKFEKITNNLISNALKFATKGGQVTVTAQYQTELLTLTVADTGEGIAPEHLPYIFDRFYQVDASQRRGYEGTGVGLALVRELVRLLDGQINIKSQMGVGTTITLTLPLLPASDELFLNQASTRTGALASQRIEMADPVAKNKPNPDQDNGKPTVLIVEDNDDLRTYIRSILSPTYQILEATDGQQGLDTALQTLPDLIVTDLMMPRIDGLELCRTLRADTQTSHIPVVMLTARATLDERIEGLETGADDYLTKPFVSIELLVRVQNLLVRQQALRQFLRNQLVALAKPGAQAVDESDVSSSGRNQQQQAFLARLQHCIDERIDQSDFDVEQLAQSVAMSSRTLNRKLAALLDLSALDLIRQHRLRRAAEWLQTGLSPSETAYRVGFDNPSYFSRVFRERYGKTPSEYGLGEKPVGGMAETE